MLSSCFQGYFQGYGLLSRDILWRDFRKNVPTIDR